MKKMSARTRIVCSFSVSAVVGLMVIASLVVVAQAQRDGSRRAEPASGFDFIVEIDGITMGAFKNVEGLDSETEIVEFRDGTDPTVVRKLPGRTTYSNVILKRGYALNDDLWQWRQALVDGTLDRRNGSISIHNAADEEVLRYEFFDAWPSKWKGFTLDGKGTDVAIEEIELAVEKIERVSR